MTAPALRPLPATMKTLGALPARMPLLLLLVTTSALSVPVSLAEESCTVQLAPYQCPPENPMCTEQVECHHGRCEPNLGCSCDPCWTGKSCNEYVDKFRPAFAVHEVFHQVRDSPEGRQYQVEATDADLGSSCPLGVAGPPARCPCAEVAYRLLGSDLAPSLVTVDRETGRVSVADPARLAPGTHYRVQIEAQAVPPADVELAPMRDLLNLTLFRAVDVDAQLKEAMEEAEGLEDADASAILPPPGGLPELSRAKRDSSGAGPETTTMDLVRTSDSAVTSPKIGALLTWNFDITLPTVSDMDMKVEIFVADLDTGNTVFEILDAAVTTVGSGVTSTAGTLTDLVAEKHANALLPEYTDRVVLNLGSLSNTDPETGGTVGGSLIRIACSVLVVHNPAVTAGTEQYVSAGAEYSGANYVQISQETFTPDSTATDMVAGASAISAASGTVTAALFSAGVAEVTIPVVAAIGEVYVEAYLVHGMDEDALSIGGTYIKLGSDYVGTKNFNGDVYKYTEVKTSSNKATTFKSIYFTFRQSGAATAAASDAGRAITLQIPVFASELATVGGTATLMVYAKPRDRFADSDLGAGTVAISIVVASGSEVVGSGSISAFDTTKSALASSSLDVPAKSTVLYLETASAPTGAGVYSTPETFSLDTSAVTDLRACDIEVLPGANIVYMEVSPVTLTPADGESSAAVTINKYVIAPTTTDATGYEISFRVAVRAGASGSATLNPGNNALSPVNVTGDPAGTQPTVTVYSSSTSTKVYIGQWFGLDMQIDYPVNDLFSTTDADFNVEFVNDLRLPYEVKFCSARVLTMGRNLPCARAKLTGVPLQQTFSRSNDTRNYDDVLSTVLPLTCAASTKSEDNQLIVRAVAKIMPGQTLGETLFRPGAGLEFDENTLFAGLVDLTMAAEPTSYVGTDPVVYVSAPPPLTFGKVHMVRIFVEIPPASHSPNLSLTVESPMPDVVRVDRVLLLSLGRDVGCVSGEPVNADLLDTVTAEMLPAFSVDADTVLGSSCRLDVGAVSNVGKSTNPSESQGDPRFVGEDHAVFAAAVQHVYPFGGAVPADASVDLTVTLGKDASAALAPTTVSVSFSGASTEFSATGTDPAPTITVNPRDDTTIYRGIPKVVDVKMDIPDGFFGTLKVTCSNSDGGQWAVTGAAAVSSGANIFGVWPAEFKPVTTTQDVGGMTLGAEAVLTLPYITRINQVSPSNSTHNSLSVACVAMVPTDSTLAQGGSVAMSVAVTDGSDAAIGAAATATLTLQDTFTPPPSVISINKTIELNTTMPTPSGTIGEYFWVPFRAIIPPGIHDAELAVVTPSTAVRALFTIHGIRYGTKIGMDVMGAPVLSEGILNYTLTNTNITHPLQYDTLLVDLGFITNLGLSSEVYRGKGGQEEWGIDMEVLVRATDHPNLHTAATATHPMYISLKLGDTIMVEKQDITATVAGTEKIELETELTLLDPDTKQYDKDTHQRVGLSVLVRHSNTSTQEGEDTRVVIIFPPYMTYENDSAVFNSSSLTVLFKDSSVALVVGEMWFVDTYSINFTALIDPNFVRGRGSGWANATTLARPICKPTLPTAAFTRCGPMTYTMYEVNNPECSDTLIATLDDCYFVASAAIEEGVHGPAGIKDGAAGWRPPVRDDPSWVQQHVEVRFNVPTRISGWKVVNAVGARAVESVSIWGSDNGITFDKKSTGTVTGDKVDLLESSFSARFVRIRIETAAAGTGYIQLTAELYGCFTGDRPAATCPVDATDNTVYTTAARKWRHFAVDTTNGIVYYCDYDLARDAVLCFSSKEGDVWIGQPKYIGELRGHSGGKMYAYDSKFSSTLASEDGQHWQVVAPADVPGTFDAVSVVKGKTAADLSAETAVAQGGWEGDYYGLKKAGATDYLIKWSKCCN